MTGAFHHDGLADMADAFGGGWTREQRLTILFPQNSLRFERQKERIFAIISPILTRRLEQEGFRLHGERAEERSRQRLGEVAAIYDIGQALDQIEQAAEALGAALREVS